MGRCRFVQPGRVRLSLSDGEWIDVKEELTAGEHRRVFANLVRGETHVGEKYNLDPERVGKTKIVEYLVGWSLLDAQGHPAVVSDDAIDLLDLDTYQEIEKAVDAHEERLDAARAARKNGQGGEKISPAILPSPSVAAGVSSGSAN